MNQNLYDKEEYRSCLLPNFQHGYATAAYQVEGGLGLDGQGGTVWDKFFENLPFDGKDACDSYHQWEQDIALLKSYGSNTYRFGIAWSRIIPSGGKGDEVNEIGIAYYQKLIDGLIKAGIEPVATLFHYDTPSVLEERYNGWTCDNPYDIVDDFARYSDICFARLGDRVKNWITINEPYIFCCHNATAIKKNFKPIDFFKIGQRVLLAHAHSVKIYREQYQPKQQGVIGLALNCEWNEPIDDSPAAKKAADEAIARSLNWFADPITAVKMTLSETRLRLINAVLQRKTLISFKGPPTSKYGKGNADESFGINAYGTAWTTGKTVDPLDTRPASHSNLYGGGVFRVFEKDGQTIGKRGRNGHPYIVPWGFRKLLQHCWHQWAASRQHALRIFENGYAIDGEENMTLTQALKDTERQEFYNLSIQALCDVVKEDGAIIQTYLAWSLLDNLEWEAGYASRFGCTYVDRANGFARHPKDSTRTMRRIWQHVIDHGAE